VPVRYKCKKCGYVLYEADWLVIEIEGGLMSPIEIILRYLGVCPKCGRRLEVPRREDIVVKRRERCG
jgi:hypothetical protein